jgi:hypothetical protein
VRLLRHVAQGRDEASYKISFRKFEERRQFRKLGIHVRIILILRMEMWIGSIGGLCEYSNKPSVFIKE